LPQLERQGHEEGVEYCRHVSRLRLSLSRGFFLNRQPPRKWLQWPMK
jgi:hypothetical protein